MTLHLALAGPCDLLAKLERERYRAFHHEHPIHKADHFYNFCVTAWSMADYLAKAGKADHVRWLAVPEIAAARDVANTVKHFTLDYAAKTAAVRSGVFSVIKFFKQRGRSRLAIRDDTAPSLTVEMSDGTKFEMWKFMELVIAYWKSELSRYGIACPEQTADDLHGRTDERRISP